VASLVQFKCMPTSCLKDWKVAPPEPSLVYGTRAGVEVVKRAYCCAAAESKQIRQICSLHSQLVITAPPAAAAAAAMATVEMARIKLMLYRPLH